MDKPEGWTVKETKGEGWGAKNVKKCCWLRDTDCIQGEVQASFDGERVGTRWEDNAQTISRVEKKQNMHSELDLRGGFCQMTAGSKAGESWGADVRDDATRCGGGGR